MRQVRLLLAGGLILFGGIGSATAQTGTGRVTGTVKNVQGEPIEGAKVVAEGSGLSLDATTDEEGRWAILGFRGGSYTFTISAPGYASQTVDARIQEMGRNPRMDVVLEEATAASGAGPLSALLSEANQHFSDKQYQEALAKYQEILEKDPTLYLVRLNMGMTYREMGDLEAALSEFEAVLEQEPAHTSALVQAGEILVKQGELERAVSYFEKAIQGAPEDSVLPFNVAEIYFNTGNPAKAIEYYEKASAVKPDWPDPYLKLGYAYLNVGKLEEAAAAFQKVVEVAPDSTQAEMAKAALDSLGKS